MTTKTKTAKIENAAAAISDAFNAAASKFAERLALLVALDVSAFSETETKAHKAELTACKNRADRNAEFAALMLNEKFSAAFIRFSLTVEAVNKLQIYAQDKLQATLQAIAAECALSSVRAGNHSNMMTQRLIAALDKHSSMTVADAPRFMHSLFPDKSMGTYSAQASSSRQVLEVLKLIDFDALTKAFSLNASGKELRSVIAA